jgi:Holliday junction DNA helicase RuvA
MIAFVSGIVAEITPEAVVLDTGGIGYNIRVTQTTAAKIAAVGERAKLYTYTCVREDAFLLYGFLSKDELGMFHQLLSVSGIGPKSALAILSAMDTDALRLAILSGDIGLLSKAPGIGKKTAERLVVDLKDKISKESAFLDSEKINSWTNGTNELGATAEAVMALVALGYSQSESTRVVKSVEGYEVLDAGALLKAALKRLS